MHYRIRNCDHKMCICSAAYEMETRTTKCRSMEVGNYSVIEARMCERLDEILQKTKSVRKEDHGV